MKIIARIATAVTAAFVSVFLAAPAFASGGEGERHNPADAFSTAGDPLQVGAILTVGVVLLAIVLLLATGVGNLFNKK